MKTAAAIAYIALVFFLGHHDLNYSLMDHFDLSVEVLEATTVEGHLTRRVAFAGLGAFAVAGLLGKGRNGVERGGGLAWLLCFFAFWSLLSVAWSFDPRLTFRRLGIFAILSMSACAVIRQHRVGFLPSCAFFVTGSYLLAGVAVEAWLGTLRPLDEGYRLAGTLHPNIQGTNCALMTLSSAALAETDRHGRWFLAAGGMALIALMLTRSRTSLLGACCALAALILVRGRASRAHKAAGVALVACGSAWMLWAEFAGEGAARLAETLFLLGRTAEGPETLLGRLGIWQGCLHYVAQRPWRGYGFNSFWLPGNIREFSDTVGIGINGAHSLYLELLLDLGVPGLAAFVLMLWLGMRGTARRYRRAGGAGYAFLFMLLVFTSVHGLLEGEALAMSFQSFLLAAGWTHLAFQRAETGVKP